MSLIFRNVWELIAPHYLLISFIAPFSSYLVISASLPSFNFVLALVSFSLVVLGFNVTNMIFDLDVDKINKPRRPIPSGRVSINEAFFLSFLLFFSGLFIALLVNEQLPLVMLLFIFLSTIYNYPKFSFRHFPLASNVMGALLYGLIPYLIAHFVLVSYPVNYVFLVFFMGLYFVIASSKDFEDIAGERKVGRKSLPIVLGEKKTALFMLGGEFVLLFSLFLAALFNFVSFIYFYSILFSLILFIFQFKLVSRNYARRNSLKDLVLQSNLVTVSILFVILVQIVFGFSSLL
ncbi:UbiA family prenyltransferase [Candidatus Micrarchaeota archaeon]|nr:UbiA family prenyltransferase [Candidatus Micrarchaeota archaeon]